MNGFHFAHLARRLARTRRPRRVAICTALAVLGLVAVALTWLALSPQRGADAQPRPVVARLADAPSWDQPQPAGASPLPELPAASRRTESKAAAVATAAASIAPAPAMTGIAPPLIVAGPELFGPAIAPRTAINVQPLPAAPNPPPALAVFPPAASRPVPIVAPIAVLLPRPSDQRPPSEFLPPPSDQQPAIPAARSEAMEKIAAQADQQIRHGFELASHGACFAARAEFTSALRLIAQGLDNERNTTVHSQALSAALTAMKEAQDFIPAGGKLEGELDLPAIIAGHVTPVLKSVPPRELQAMRALKQYFSYAQEELALAAGQEVSGSMALGALGKMHAALAGKPSPEVVAPEAKAIVFFQAAILVCPQNYMAANDLGVLLAHCGDSQGARRVLEHSVLVCRCAENLGNLSAVYRQVGEPRLADLAAEKAQAAKTTEASRQRSASLSAGGRVEWVNADALAQSPEQWADPPARPAANAGEQGRGPAGPASPQPVVGMVPSAGMTR